MKNPDTRAIINAQPPGLMAFSVTHRQLDVRTIPESWIFLHDVPSLPFGSQLYPASEIVDVLSDKIPAVLVQNDSFIATGKKLIQAFDRLEVAEFSAQSIIMAESIGKLIPIGNGQIDDLRRTFK
jgi:L-fuculose-phosphate aldolase